MNKKNFKLNFIGVGAPRCPTTWLSKCLAEHPQIDFSKEKEIHFFDKDCNYKKGLDFYKKFFKEESKIKGEFSPSYFLEEKTAKRIKKFFPNVKIIVSLRDPAERTLSNYFYNKKRGLICEKSWRDFWCKHKKSRTITNSFYYEKLNIFLKYFDSEKILIVFPSTMNNEKLIKKVYKFLSVDENYLPSVLEKPINTSKGEVARWTFFNRLVNKRKIIKKTRIGEIFLNFLKKIGVNNIIKFLLKINKKKEDKEVISFEDKKKLFNYYKEDLKKLEQLINKDLNFWFKKYEN